MATDKKRRMDGCKLLWHMDRVIEHYDHKNPVSPIHIDVGLTKKCNMRCVMCYGYFQNMNGASIERKALLENLIESAGNIGVRSLGFIGDGEPTLNPAWTDALRLTARRGMDASLATNGVRVDDDEKRAAVLENCKWMRFHISAITEEGYKKIHNSKARDKVLDNIKALIKYKHKHKLECEIGLQMVFVPTMMVQEVIPLAQFAIECGADYFVIKQCSLPDKGESGMVHFDVDDYDDPEVIDTLKQAEMMSTDRTDIVPKWDIINLKGEKKYDHCRGVQLLPEISGDGGMYPCAYFFGGNRPEFCYGNVHEQTLEEIVFSQKYWDIVDHMNEKFDPHHECKGCCRQDKTNEFIHDYINKPKGINFI